MFCLPAWHGTNLFTEKEVAALQFCEALTYQYKGPVKAKDLLINYFSERELVDLAACIALMNALNRIATSLKD